MCGFLYLYKKYVMKVLIIALPRTGSTALMIGLSKSLNTEMISEPWYQERPDKKIYPLKLKEKYVEKSMITHVPQNLNISSEDFFLEYYKKFDCTILLGRRNLTEMTESLVYALENNRPWTNDWHTSYSISKNKKFKNFDKVYKDYVQKTVDLVKLSSKIQIPITWYEDLFLGNKNTVTGIIKEWALDIDQEKFKKFLNPANKYRKTTNII